MAAVIPDTASWSAFSGTEEAGDIVGKVRFCQLTAVALQAKVN